MAQQQQDNSSRMRSLMVMYVIMLLGYWVFQQYFGPKPVQTPTEAASLLTQAWGKERRVREIIRDRTKKRLEDIRSNPSLAGADTPEALEDAVQNQEAAIQAYDKLYGTP